MEIEYRKIGRIRGLKEGRDTYKDTKKKHMGKKKREQEHLRRKVERKLWNSGGGGGNDWHGCGQSDPVLRHPVHN